MVKAAARLTAKDFYNQVASFYDYPVNKWFYQKIAQALLGLIPDNKPIKSILEIGGGCGFATLCLQERYPQAEITVLEPSLAMLARGIKRAPFAQWHPQTVNEFHSGAQYDLVFASMSAHWLTLTELEKLVSLSKNGMLALALPVCADANNELQRLTKKIMRQLKVHPVWSKEVRSLRGILNCLSACHHLTVNTLNFTEEFSQTTDLIKTLAARGVFYSLFNGHAETAQKLLLKQSLQENLYKWEIKLIAASL